MLLHGGRLGGGPWLERAGCLRLRERGWDTRTTPRRNGRSPSPSALFSEGRVAASAQEPAAAECFLSQADVVRAFFEGADRDKDRIISRAELERFVFGERERGGAE